MDMYICTHVYIETRGTCKKSKLALQNFFMYGCIVHMSKYLFHDFFFLSFNHLVG